MKKILLALAALASATAASAAPRPTIDTTITSNLGSSDVNYGVNVGVENSLNRNLDFFAKVGAENFADDNRSTTYAASTGLDARISGPVRAYGLVGYLNTSGNDGYRLGAGLGFDLTRNLRLRAGVQRDDYGRGVDGTTGSLSLRAAF